MTSKDSVESRKRSQREDPEAPSTNKNLTKHHEQLTETQKDEGKKISRKENKTVGNKDKKEEELNKTVKNDENNDDDDDNDKDDDVDVDNDDDDDDDDYDNGDGDSGDDDNDGDCK